MFKCLELFPFNGDVQINNDDDDAFASQPFHALTSAYVIKRESSKKVMHRCEMAGLKACAVLMLHKI